MPNRRIMKPKPLLLSSKTMALLILLGFLIGWLLGLVVL